VAIRDIKNKIEKLENLVNVKQEPAQWALDYAGTTFVQVHDENGQMRNAPYKTEEDIYQEALELTLKYGTRERFNEEHVYVLVDIYQANGPHPED
jgi:hypothetical protein